MHRTGGQVCRTPSGLVRRVVVVAWGLATLGVPAAAQAPSPTFPLTLQAAITYASDHYPAIRAAAEQVAARESAVDLARTAYLPRLDSSLQVNRATRNNVAGLLLPGTIIPPISGPVSPESSSATIWGSGAGLLASWEAFDFGLRGASVELAGAQAARARAGAAVTRLEVSVAAADAFLRLAAAQEAVRAARASVERQEVFATAVGALVRSQLRPGADESRVQAELAAARIQLIQAEQAEQVARAALAQWLGAAVADVQIVAEPLLRIPPGPDAPPATGSHPLADAQRAAVDSSLARRHVLDRSYVPRISLQAAYSLRGTGAALPGTSSGSAHGLGFDTPNWAVGVTATFPLMEWFSLREQARIEAHTALGERATYDRIVQELSTRVTQARAEIEGARRVAEQTPVQLQAARVLEGQSRARYDAGLATVVDVADSERLLLQAEVGDAVARLGVWRALLAEAAARGDLSSFVQ